MEEAQYEIDLGNLMAFDRIHQFATPPTSREEVVKEAIEQGTKLVQAVADALFNLRSTEDRDGPLVKLHAPTTRLPREKPWKTVENCGCRSSGANTCIGCGNLPNSQYGSSQEGVVMILARKADSASVSASG